MFYTYPVTIPANTLEGSPVIVDCPLYPATINRVSVQFPPGCAGLAHVVIWRGIHQVWPTDTENSFASDGETIDFMEDYALDAEPYLLKVRGWNDDDAYQHVVTVTFGVLRLHGQGGGGILDQLRGVFGLT